MLNWVAEKVATHFIMGRLSGPLIRLHALVIGHRTDICLAGWAGTYVLQYAGIIDQAHAEHARAYLLGAGGIALADKVTRYGNIADVLVVKAKALEEEQKDQ